MSNGSVTHAYTVRMAHLKNVSDAHSDPCPAGFRWVIRTISVAYGGFLATVVNIYVADVLVLIETLFTQPNGPSYTIFSDYIVMEAGEQIHATSNAQDQGIDVTASGYQLSLS
jgi:hypothetical protein